MQKTVCLTQFKLHQAKGHSMAQTYPEQFCKDGLRLEELNYIGLVYWLGHVLTIDKYFTYFS